MLSSSILVYIGAGDGYKEQGASDYYGCSSEDLALGFDGDCRDTNDGSGSDCFRNVMKFPTTDIQSILEPVSFQVSSISHSEIN